MIFASQSSNVLNGCNTWYVQSDDKKRQRRKNRKNTKRDEKHSRSRWCFLSISTSIFPITFNLRFSHLRRVWVCKALLCDSLALSKMISVRVVHMYVSALAHLITLTSIIDQLAAYHSGHDTLCSICYNSLAHDFFSIQITCFFCAESSAEQTSD